MVLIDTSIWVDHFRNSNEELVYLLNECKVVLHPFIIGELACGNVRNRRRILSLLNALPRVKEISAFEYITFIEQNKIYGIGLGFVDIHLLASALLSKARIYTNDRNLYSVAKKFKIQYK